jgi:hypothetical protein
MTRRFHLVLSLTAAAILGGCGAGSRADDTGSVESAARDGEERTDGIYEVPTTADLAYAASNPVTVKLRTLGGGRFQLKYDLPEVIAGFGREVDLVGGQDANGVWQLSGPSGTGSCTESGGGEFVCTEKLDGVAMSLAEATVAVNAMAVSDVERNARQTVAAEFIIDPLGIVKFQRFRPDR